MKNTLIILVLVILASCDKNPSGLKEPDLVNAKVPSSQDTMIIVPGTVPGDSVTYASVILKVGAMLYPKYKQATVSISPIGKFNNDSSTITVLIGVDSEAHFTVFSATSGTAYLTATVGNITRFDSIVFKPVQDTLNLTTTPDTILADSITYASVKLKVDGNLYSKYKQASFTISPVGRFNNNSTNITVPIGIDSAAHLSVFSNVSGTAYITATVGNVSKVDTVIFLQSIDTISLFSPPTKIPADNTTLAVINAQLSNPDVLQKQTSITFSTNKGTFANNATTFTTNVYSNSSGNPVATAYLKDNMVETATVSANLPSGTVAYTKQTSVNFTPSYPDIISIMITPGIIFDSVTQISITAQLTRNNGGTLTPSQVVNFRDSLDISGASVGLFSSTIATVNSGNQATTTYTIPDTVGLHGHYVYIIGSLDTGSVIRNYNKIYVE